jgi:putative effector of murein hydrolase LrgA (UPF0299 family)
MGNPYGVPSLNLSAGKLAQQQSKYGIAMSIIGLLILFVVIGPYFLINLVLNIVLTIIVLVVGIFFGHVIYKKNYKRYKDTIISSDE